jgi:hypothetical protein
VCRKHIPPYARGLLRLTNVNFPVPFFRQGILGRMPVADILAMLVVLVGAVALVITVGSSPPQTRRALMFAQCRMIHLPLLNPGRSPVNDTAGSVLHPIASASTARPVAGYPSFREPGAETSFVVQACVAFARQYRPGTCGTFPGGPNRWKLHAVAAKTKGEELWTTRFSFASSAVLVLQLRYSC